MNEKSNLKRNRKISETRKRRRGAGCIVPNKGSLPSNVMGAARTADSELPTDEFPNGLALDIFENDDD